MKKIIYPIVILGLIGLFGYTLWFLYQKSQEEPMVPMFKKAAYRDIIRKTVATGSVIPRNEILIKPNISGIINKVYVTAGEHVKKGDILAEIRIIPDMAQLNNAESRVNKAKISLENAELNYKRQKSLADEGVISAAEFENTMANYRNAKEELSAAQENLEIIKEGASKKSASSSNTRIRSTVDGMLLDVPVEVGNSVIEANNFNEGTTIAAIANMKNMVFEGKVDESEVGKIKEGMPLILTIGAIENERFDAVLEYISPKGVDENGAIQFEIRAKVNITDSSFIRAGYSANAAIVLEQRNNILALEESLLQFDGKRAFIEVESKDKSLEKIYLETGLSDGIYIEVLEDLDTNMRIKSGMVPAGTQQKHGKGNGKGGGRKHG